MNEGDELKLQQTPTGIAPMDKNVDENIYNFGQSQQQWEFSTWY